MGFFHLSRQELKIRSIKPLSELLLVATLMDKLNIENKFAHDIAEMAWREFDHGDYITKVLISRPDLLILAETYSSFRHFNFVSASLENLLPIYFKHTNAFVSDRPEWQLMGIHSAFARQAGISINSEYYKKTWLSVGVAPWTISTETAYSITHEVFYLTNFGEFPDNLGIYRKQYFTTWVPVWLEIYALENNFDILGELVLSCLCANVKCDIKPAIDHICSNQTNSGAVPGPRFNQLKGIISKEENFQHNYHTSLVSILSIGMLKNKQLQTK